MKKIIAISVGILILLAIVLSILYLYDQPLRGKIYTMADLPAAPFTTDNGFFQLWGLAEPEGVNVQSEEYIAFFRRLFEPGAEGDAEKRFKDYEKNSNRKKFDPFRDAIKQIRFPKEYKEDWLTILMPQVHKVEATRQTCALLLKRYQTLLNTPVIADCTPPHIMAPIPPFLQVLNTVKLYTAISLSKVISGNWQEATSDLLTQLDFAKRFAKGSRIQLTNNIAKSIMRTSLQALVSLMNHPDCPKTVYKQVINSMPPLRPEEYGNQTAIIFESLTFMNTMDNLIKLATQDIPTISGQIKNVNTLFFKINATKNTMNEFLDRMLTYDRLPPYQWRDNPFTTLSDFVEKQELKSLPPDPNGIGKIMFSILAPSPTTILYKANFALVHYELTRLLADLQLHHTAGRPIIETLTGLESYRTFDPGSGKPFRWDEEKKVLYGIGVDGRDNGGVQDQTNVDSDFVVPVVLKNQSLQGTKKPQ